MEKSTPLRICLITNLYPPYTRGGAERVVEVIARTLKEDGHTVSVVTSVPSWTANLRAFVSGGWITETRDGISIYRIASANFFPYWTIGAHNTLMRFFWHLFDMFAVETASLVRKILRREKPDVVMTHNLKGLGFLIPRAIRRLHIRHIHTVHDVQLAVPSGLIFVGRNPSLLMMAALECYERIVRWLVGSPDVVIFPSQWLLDFYVERGFFPKSKKVVLHNPVIASEAKSRSHGDRGSSTESGQSPGDRHGPSTTAKAGQASSGSRDDKNVVRFLYVGQLERHKGILFLIDTIKKFQIVNFKLQVVGTGSLLEKIKRIASDDPRITIHGPVPHEKLSEFYAQADALIVPSLVHENAPTVIFEAFAHGLPVIASRVGGVPEFVREGGTGWLFTGGDTDDFLRTFERSIPNLLKGFQFPRSALQNFLPPKPYVQKLIEHTKFS